MRTQTTCTRIIYIITDGIRIRLSDGSRISITASRIGSRISAQNILTNSIIICRICCLVLLVFFLLQPTCQTCEVSISTHLRKVMVNEGIYFFIRHVRDCLFFKHCDLIVVRLKHCVLVDHFFFRILCNKFD